MPVKMARSGTVEDRLSHCQPCENNKFGICKKCGCVIQGKVRFANQKCPVGLWGPEESGLKSLIVD